MFKPDIVFEDNHLLVVNKPVNIPVQADKSGDQDLLSELKGYLARTYDKKGNVYLGLVHRLDRPVGGLMIFAKTSKAASRLSDFQRRNLIKKHYIAVVYGEMSGSVKLIHWLLKDTSSNMVSVFDKEVNGSKKAVLHYRVIGRTDGFSLLEIELETGRPHQIRAQFAKIGHPLWGDHRYNFEKSKKGEQIALLSMRLNFEHPVRKEPLKFELPKPESKPWNWFK